MKVVPRTLALLFAVSPVMACGSSESTTDSAPFHPVTEDAVGVTGTATCSFSGDGFDPEGGSGLLVECDLDMSDPRVSGVERIDRFRNFGDPDSAAVVWVAEEDVITNGGGVWRGSAQAGDDTTPCGEAHFVGEDAYDGLEFHYYFCHTNESAPVRGWISGDG